MLRLLWNQLFWLLPIISGKTLAPSQIANSAVVTFHITFYRFKSKYFSKHFGVSLKSEVLPVSCFIQKKGFISIKKEKNHSLCLSDPSDYLEICKYWSKEYLLFFDRFLVLHYFGLSNKTNYLHNLVIFPHTFHFLAVHIRNSRNICL